MGVTVEKINVLVSVDNQQAIVNTEKFTKAMEDSRKELQGLQPNSKEFNDEMQKLIKSTENFAKNASFNDLRRQFNSLQREQKNTTEGTKEYVIATAQLRVVGKRLGDVKQSMKDIQKATQETEGYFKRLINQGNAVRVALVGALAAGISKLKSFGSELVDLYDIQAKAEAQVKNVLISTNQAAGRSFEQLKEQAEELSSVTLFNDELTLQAQSLLLTFTNVRTEVFDRTIPLIQDYATSMAVTQGGTADLKDATIQLGKALNNPLTGYSALSRAGVTFSDQQKDQIKTLVESGKTVEAQTIILKELEKEFGNSAKAAALAGKGGFDQLEGTMVDLKQAVGELIVNAVNPFIPKLKQLGNGAIDFVKGLKDAPRVIKQNLDLIALFTTVIALFNKERILSTAITVKNTAAQVANRVVLIASTTATKTLSAIQVTYSTVTGILTGRIKLATVAQRVFNLVLKANPIGLVITAVGLLVAAFANLYKNSETVRATLSGLAFAAREIFVIITEVASEFVKSTLQAFNDFRTNAQPLFSFIQGVVEFYIEAYSTIIKGTIGFAKAFGNVVKGDLKGAFQSFKDTFESENPLGSFGKFGERIGKAYVDGFNTEKLGNANKEKSKELGANLANSLVDGFGGNFSKKTAEMEKVVAGSIDDLKARIKAAKQRITQVVDIELQNDLIAEIDQLELDLDQKKTELQERLLGEKIVVVQPIQIDFTETQVTPQLNPDDVATPEEQTQSIVTNLQRQTKVDELAAFTQLTEAKIALYEDETIAAETRTARLEQLDNEYQLKVIANQQLILQTEIAAKESLNLLDEEYFNRKNQLLELSTEKARLESENQKIISAEVTANITDDIEESQKRMENIQRQQADILKGFIQEAGGLFGDFITNQENAREEFGKNLTIAAIETAEKIVNIKFQEALATATLGAFASPDSAATGGITGAIKTLALTAALKAALTFFKSKIQQSFETGGFAPVAKGKGGIPQGPRHKDNGIKMIDGQTGRFVGELEGGEPVLSRETYKNNKETIDRLLYASMYQRGKTVFEEGGFIPSAPSSGVISNISNFKSLEKLPNSNNQQNEKIEQDLEFLKRAIAQYPTYLKSEVIFEDLLEKRKVYEETIKNAGGQV